jgi:hypothetical protein
MKKSMKIFGVLGTALILSTGVCPAQVAGTVKATKSAGEAKPG